MQNKILESLIKMEENAVSPVEVAEDKVNIYSSLYESLINSANRVKTNNCKSNLDITGLYEKALQEGIHNVYPNNHWTDITKCNIRQTLLENKNDVKATINRIVKESIDNNFCDEYIDVEGMFTGKAGGHIHIDELKAIYDEDKDWDPSISEASSFEDWMNGTIESGYLVAITEDDEDDFEVEESLKEKIDDELFKKGYFADAKDNNDPWHRNSKAPHINKIMHRIGKEEIPLNAFVKPSYIDQSGYGYDYENSTAHKISKEQAIKNFENGEKVFKLSIDNNSGRTIITEIISLNAIKSAPKDTTFLDSDFHLAIVDPEKSALRGNNNAKTYVYSKKSHLIDLLNDRDEYLQLLKNMERTKKFVPDEFKGNKYEYIKKRIDEINQNIAKLTGKSIKEIDFNVEESLTEDTVKQGNSWVNKGEEGTHGKFKTKKEADAQRKAMFANGYKGEGLKESSGRFVIDLTGYDYPETHYFYKLDDDGSPLDTKNINQAKVFKTFEDAANFAAENIVADEEDLPGIINLDEEDFDDDLEPIEEDIVKKADGKWVNRSDKGIEHGEFRTKKAADAQRKAMFANMDEEETEQVAYHKEFTRDGKKVSVELWKDDDEFAIKVNKKYGDDIPSALKKEVNDVIDKKTYDTEKEGKSAVDKAVDSARKQIESCNKEELTEDDETALQALRNGATLKDALAKK